MSERDPEYLPGGYQAFRVYDPALKRKYSTTSLDEGLEVVDEQSTDGAGNLLPPEFDVTKSGRPTAAATSQEAPK